MPDQSTSPFAGFSPGAVQFLIDLAANNERAWFQPRKAEYERLLKEPLEALCVTLGERFAARGVPLDADPSRSPFRIYRDVRFSKDKSPYKTHVAASFGYAGDMDRAHGVGGYFHLSPGEAYVGGGMWHPEPARLAAFRSAVVSDGAAVRALVSDKAFVRAFGQVSGERLKRVPSGFAADHPDAELLKLKDVTFGRQLDDDDVLSPRLPDIITDAFVAGIPMLRFLSGLAAA